MKGRLALFDLDNTLLAGDSDHAWGEFLIERGLVDADSHRAANDAYYQNYLAGELDIHDYVNFTVAPVMSYTEEERNQLHDAFMQKAIRPMILPKSRALIESRQVRGDTCIIITATNDFITAPIAKELGVDILIATQLETIEGKLTGKIQGEPCYHEGKVKKLAVWMQQEACRGHHFDLSSAVFYTDSINDLPLLEQVSEPVAVDPDDSLKREAQARQWKVISLR